MFTHQLYSHDSNNVVALFEKFNKEDIKKEIIEHLQKFPEDMLQFEKISNDKKYVGNDILGFYEVNQKNKKVSKVVTKGNRDFYVPLQY